MTSSFPMRILAWHDSHSLQVYMLYNNPWWAVLLQTLTCLIHHFWPLVSSLICQLVHLPTGKYLLHIILTLTILPLKKDKYLVLYCSTSCKWVFTTEIRRNKYLFPFLLHVLLIFFFSNKMKWAQNNYNCGTNTEFLSRCIVVVICRKILACLYSLSLWCFYSYNLCFQKEGRIPENPHFIIWQHRDVYSDDNISEMWRHSR